MQITYDLTEIDSVAEKLIGTVDSKILLLYGKMGTGKTTLVKALVKALKGTDDVSSPTFSLVNEYELADGLAYHFDMYRIKSVEEVLDLGFEDYIASDAWIFIEWPENIDFLLPDLSVKVYIKKLENGSRALDLELVNSNN